VALTRRQFVLRAAGAGAGLAVPGWIAQEAPAAAGPWLRELARAVRGPLILPGSARYGAVAHGYNERYDGLRPRAVLVAHGPGDVQQAVRWAARHGVRIAARSGGHSYAGYSTADGGLVVDLSRLGGIALRDAGTRVIIGAGARLGPVYARLAAHGVTVPAGSCPTVGMGGLAQGGGMGFAGRALGLTSDRIAGLRIVTADGRLRHAAHDSEQDLLWACRGGGGGNFGIVTSFELRTARVRQAAWFSVSWPASQAAEALAAWQELMGSAPDALTSVLSLSTGPHIAAAGQLLGAESRLPGLLRPLTRVAGAHLTHGTLGYGAMMRRWAGGATGRARFAAGSDYVDRPLSASGRAAALAAVRRPSGSGILLLDSYGGAINRVAADATAFVHRDALCSIQYLDYGPSAAGTAWVRAARRTLAPHVSGEAYQNYIDPDLAHWRRAYYGSNLDRLRAIKSAVDPHRVFDFAQAI
jgi:FAD/FMN-containing dehydrogenase